MRTLLAVATLVTAALPLGKVNHAPSVLAPHEVTIVDGTGPDEPIPQPSNPKRA